ncbi:MAG: hypothetical protein JSU03_02910 [Bacteroidetes bacterium]|nr:hypothetical protein [Bacteroidota bacterium]MBS1756208.1 hypothetical protein [Bacteroidota bacterium]
MKQPSLKSEEIYFGLAEKIYFDDATKDRIRKHLSDINDVITEEDIRNVKTDISILPASLQQVSAKRE